MILTLKIRRELFFGFFWGGVGYDTCCVRFFCFVGISKLFFGFFLFIFVLLLF